MNGLVEVGDTCNTKMGLSIRRIERHPDLLVTGLAVPVV